MKTISEMKSLFTDKAFVGDVLRTTTLIEVALDCTLAYYYARADRIEPAVDSLLSEIPFGKKIDILAALPLRTTLKSRNASVASLRRLRRIRNHIAHNWRIDSEELNTLLKDQNIAHILSGYPKSLFDELQRTRAHLQILMRTREFQDRNANTRINYWDFMTRDLFK